MSLISTWGPTLLIFLGAITAAIGGVWAQINQSKHDTEIKTLQKETINYLTGGKSYCSVMLEKTGSRFILCHTGEYPVYDLKIEVVDFQSSNGKPIIPKCIDKEIKEAQPDVAVMMRYPFLYNDRTKAEYNFFMYARNGMTIQNLKLKKINNKWEYATSVMSREGIKKELIYEKKSLNYPDS